MYKQHSEIEDISKEQLSKEFKHIFDEYKNLVYYVIIKIINIPTIAEEILNDTFLILYQHWYQIRDKKKIKSYLTTTAKRLAINQAIAYKEDNENLDYSFEVENLKYDNISYHNSFNELIDKFKNYLSDEDLDILIKSIYFKYKIKEIAKEQDVNIFTMTSRIRRLKIKLRKYYESIK